MLKNLSASQKIVFAFSMIAGLVVVASVVLVGLMINMANSANDVGARLAPLVDAAMEIKLNGANAHLVMEEIMAGDAAEDIAEVAGSLEQARFYANAILHGGSNDEGTFYPSSDPAVRHSIEGVLEGLEAFGKAAEQRHGLLSEATGVGTGADEAFDSLYEDLVARLQGLADGNASAELQMLIGDARYLLAHGHLLVAEILGGDAGEDFNEATRSFEGALANLETVGGTFPDMAPALAEISPDIVRLRDLAIERYDRALARAAAIERAEVDFDAGYDAFMSLADEAETEIQAAMARGVATQERISTTTEIFTLAFGLSLLAILAVFYKWMDATLGKRLRLIAEAMEKITAGDHDAMPPDWGTTDEIGLLRDKLGGLRDVFLQQQALERTAAAERNKAEQGRLEAEALRLEAEQEKATAEASRKEAERRAKAAELFGQTFSQVVHAARVGDLSVRIEGSTGQDDLDQIGTALNEMLDTLDANLKQSMKISEAIAKGDLRQTWEGEQNGVFAQLQSNTNAMITSLQTLIGDISGSAMNLASSSGELRDTSDALSKQAEQNAASLEQTSAALEELTSSIRQVSDNVKEANSNAGSANETARASGVIANEAAAAMGRIADASKEIANVVTVINEISFQINLLALNAGVEAARAGEAGRGFSVVASEVRQLAQRAGDAAREIDSVIARSDQAVKEGVEKVGNAQSSLEQISESIFGVSQRIDQIASAISEQVSGVAEINGAIAQIDSTTQKQAAAFEEVSATSAMLSAEAAGLKQSTARFQIGSGASLPAVEMPRATKVAAPPPQARSVPAEVTGNLARNLNEWSDF